MRKANKYKVLIFKLILQAETATSAWPGGLVRAWAADVSEGVRHRPRLFFFTTEQQVSSVNGSQVEVDGSQLFVELVAERHGCGILPLLHLLPM